MTMGFKPLDCLLEVKRLSLIPQLLPGFLQAKVMCDASFVNFGAGEEGLEVVESPQDEVGHLCQESEAIDEGQGQAGGRELGARTMPPLFRTFFTGRGLQRTEILPRRKPVY